MGLGGNVTHCLEKFAACLERAECTALPMYAQARAILADPVANHDRLNPPVTPPNPEAVGPDAPAEPRDEL